jgi:dihydrofolate reductase
MNASVLDMSISLDGFVAGPDERLGNGLGDGGPRLHDWAFKDGEDPVNRSHMDEMLATGAVLAGRRTFDLASGWGGDHHDGVPIFLYTRRAPDPAWPAVHYTDDIVDAMHRAKAAAGEKNVFMHGVGTAQAALAAGVLDEIQLHLVPIFLGGGVRLFDHVAPGELELVRTVEGLGVTHLRYRVLA